MRNTYPSVINKVSVTESSIEIVGNCVGEGHFYLGEIPPYLDVTKIDKAPYKVELTEASFSIVLDRFIERDKYFANIVSGYLHISDHLHYKLKI